MSAEPAVRTNSTLDQHLELTVATGGTEDSCCRCTLPFSIVFLMIGIAVTAVAYSFNSHGSIISILGLVLLFSSLLLLLLSLAVQCWKIRRGIKMDRNSASQCTLVESLRS
ncbi:transmembrane protein 100-like [Clarias gariepinus]|uniref:transmembrane protein 100-like n=1 Tax=Clarias gariepinus TaxID=13013 RepID=UPI00234DC69A|nr:transmembrane protein 100-like [Clarias gariepinus]